MPIPKKALDAKRAEYFDASRHVLPHRIVVETLVAEELAAPIPLMTQTSLCGKVHAVSMYGMPAGLNFGPRLLGRRHS